MNLIAYRGLSSKNVAYHTKDAIILALNADYLSGISMHVRLTKDQELVVYDEEEFRIGNHSFGSIQDLSLNELRHFNVGNKIQRQMIPTLREILDCYRTEKILLLELADEQDRNFLFAERVAALLNQYRNINLLVTSQSKELVLYLQDLLTTGKLGLTFTDPNDYQCPIAVDFYQIPFSFHDAEKVMQKLDNHYGIVLSGISNPDEIVSLQEKYSENFSRLFLVAHNLPRIMNEI